MMPPLGLHEWIAAGYFVALCLAALWLLDWTRRVRVWATTAVVLTLISTVAFAPQVPAVAAVRTWVPALYVLVGYWLPAQFYKGPMLGVEARLLASDRQFDEWIRTDRLVTRAPRALLEWVELAYALTYVLVPGGLAVVLAVGRGDLTTLYWSVALAAHLGSYAGLLWIQIRPPWAIEPPRAIDQRSVLMRSVNRVIVRHGSNCLNTLPSGHAAGALAIALVIDRADARLGLAAFGLAASICAGAYFGRYHYAVDIVLGAVLGYVAWEIVTRLIA